MANPLKEAEATLASNTPSASANPAAKSPAADASTRPQPVALEIPVTINGAHTVEGSDKREPFSETTQTVLVFGHGSVVRVATSLVPGQLVFLTNEKSKKEVVCQVVKSKSGGSGSYYVELQFTEPAPGFWGLRMPTAPAAPAAAAAPAVVPRPASATTPTAPPALSKPGPVLPKPEAPSVIAPVPAPPKPSIVPPSAPTKPQPAAPVASSPALSVPPPPQVVPPAPAKSDQPAAAEKQSPANPAPPLRDYSKEIDSLFTVPPASTSHAAPTAPPEPKAIPPAPPSSEQLKLEAARLQAQLSSMLFTGSPSSSSSSSVTSVPPAAHKLQPPASDVAKKVFEIAHDEPKSAAMTEHKPATPPTRKPVTPPPISADDEEVKIPSWLAPLSHQSELAVAEHHAPAPTESIPELPPIHADSAEGDSIDSHQRPETAVFGGQLLGETSVAAGESSSGGSKKGLFLGLAAAIVLAGGVWYFRPALFGSSHAAAVKSASVAAASPEVAPTNPAPSELSTGPSSPVPNARLNSAPAAASPLPTVSQPSKTPAATPTPAVMATPEPGNSVTVSHNPPPPPEEPAKSPLGEVHLGAPIVSHEANAAPSADTPSIDLHEPTSGADTLPSVAISSHQQPAAPLPVGGDVHQAQLIKSVAPVYPAVAKSQHISGSVQVDALIDSSGNVAELKIISGPSLLHRAALEAVKQWKYKPAMLDGQPTSMHLVVTVQFRAQ